MGFDLARTKPHRLKPVLLESAHVHYIKCLSVLLLVEQTFQRVHIVLHARRSGWNSGRHRTRRAGWCAKTGDAFAWRHFRAFDRSSQRERHRNFTHAAANESTNDAAHRTL